MTNTLVAQRSSNSWGDWRLDDLADAFARLSRVLTPSAAVFWVALYSPVSESDLPTVQVSVPDRDTVHLLRCSVAEELGGVENPG